MKLELFFIQLHVSDSELYSLKPGLQNLPNLHNRDKETPVFPTLHFDYEPNQYKSFVWLIFCVHVKTNFVIH